MSTVALFVLAWFTALVFFVAGWIWIRKPSARDHILVTVSPSKNETSARAEEEFEQSA